MRRTRPAMDNATDPDPGQKPEVLRIIEEIELYYTPFLVAFGALGNCLSVVVFSFTKLRKLSSSFYLSALAISDTGFLFMILVTWLDMVDVSVFNRPVVCEMSVYVSSVCSFLSVWFVVAFTVERFIAVGYPLRRPSMCTVSRAKVVIACLTHLSLLLYLPLVFVAGLQPKEPPTRPPAGGDNGSAVLLCGLKKEYHKLGNVLNSIDFIFALLVPVITIFVVNASICLTVWRLARIRRAMTLGAAGQDANGIQARGASARGGRGARCGGSQTKVTRMLLIVSTVFVCLNLPSYVCRLIVHFQQKTKTETMVVWQHASLILFNTNFGINFVLYCVSGQNFRKALFALCCPKRQRLNETRVTVVSEFGKSTSTRRTVMLNGSLREAHELLPLAK